MKTQKKIVVLLVNGTAVALNAHDPVTLDELQFMVGGYIEHVPTTLKKVGGKQIIMTVNEEGKLKNLPRNPMASVYAKISAWDCIAGRAVLCKEDGEELRPFVDDEIQTVLKMFA